jgi:hypothetical protein
MHQKLIGLVGGLGKVADKSQRLRLREGVSPEVLKDIQTKVREKLIIRLKELYGSLEVALHRVAPNQKRLIKTIMSDAASGRITPLMS